MNLGFMQPYFAPYLGYFQLIARTDAWLVFDDAQMIRRGWVNRNRILKEGGGWSYARVPVRSHGREARIAEVEVAESGWGDRLIAQLLPYRFAPGRERVVDLIERVAGKGYTRLLDVNVAFLREVCELLEVPFEPRLHSELDYDRSAVAGPGDWALEAAKAVGATGYLNPPGGRELFDPERFERAGVRLEILEPNLEPYDQGGRPFEPGLSILDALCFLEPAEVHRRLLAPGASGSNAA